MILLTLSRRGHPANRALLRLEPLEDRAVPATFTVNSTLDNLTPGDGKLTLREAITKANDLPGADVIVVPAGIFKIALPGTDENDNASGDFDITDSVTIRGAGAGKTVVDGQQLDRIIDVIGSKQDSMRQVLQGLTIRNGEATGSGGGIRVGIQADLVVRDCAVTWNRTPDSGGGIYGSVGSRVVTLVRTTVARNAAVFHGGGVYATTQRLIDCTVRRNDSTQGFGGGIYAGNTATLIGCTLSNNSASGGFGGGIYAFPEAALVRCTVSANSAGISGGGIDAGTATLDHCTVTDNSAGFSGGGIDATEATMTRCIVRGNSATDGDGGGVWAHDATLTRCKVSGNSAGISGGGVHATTATMTRCTVSGNTANDGNGAGVHATTATLTGCTVSGNSAHHGGGGIFASTAYLFNSTVSGNTADLNGGGIHADAGTLTNCTVVKNLATTGGGLFHTAFGTLGVKNTIVALNLFGTGGAAPDVSGDFASLGHNLIGDGTGGTGFTHGASGDIVGTGASPIDPKLAPLAFNGGPTKTHALLAGSPAIDRGDNADARTTDQRGLPRRKDGNGDGRAVVDIGAFEK